MRDAGNRRFAEATCAHVPDGSPILFAKNEGDYFECAFYPTRRDYIDGTNRQPLGALTHRKMVKVAQQLRAALVQF